MNECVKEEGLEGGEASDDITKSKGKKKKTGKELGVRWVVTCGCSRVPPVLASSLLA